MTLAGSAASRASAALADGATRTTATCARRQMLLVLLSTCSAEMAYDTPGGGLPPRQVAGPQAGGRSASATRLCALLLCMPLSLPKSLYELLVPPLLL